MAKFGLAQPIRRVEDPRLLKGDGRYTDDIVLPCMLHGVVLRSPHAAAIINAIIDALSADGVTHIDMPATPEKVWQALTTAHAA